MLLCQVAHPTNYIYWISYDPANGNGKKPARIKK